MSAFTIFAARTLNRTGGNRVVLRRRFLFCATLVLLACMRFSGAQGTERCKHVSVAPHHPVAKLTGEAPANDTICFVVTGLSGKRVSLAVHNGRNIVFSIPGVVDARDRYRFTAAEDTYRIVVGQLTRSLKAERFRIRVAAR